MEPLHSGTGHLNDEDFVEEFETCRLPTSQFHHADHIRLAWIYLGRLSPEAATERIEQSILRYAAHHGIGQKYHRTITVAWMKLVAAARKETPDAARFEEFATLHTELLDVKNLSRYYTAERLAGAEARSVWIAPDLQQLP